MYKVKLYVYISRELQLTTDAEFEYDLQFKAISFANAMKHEPNVAAISVTNTENNEVVYDWEE